MGPRGLLIFGLLVVVAAFGALSLELEEERALRVLGESARRELERKRGAEQPS